MMTQSLRNKDKSLPIRVVWVLISFLFIAGCPPQSVAQKCQTKAFAIDRDPNGLNVRNQPNSEAEILGTLPLYAEVNVLDHKNNWLLVSPIDPKLQEIDWSGEGYVYASLLGLNTRGYDGNGVRLYAEPDGASEVVGNVESSSLVTLVSCSGKWALVRHQSIQGWLKPEDQCEAALTTCS